MALTGKRQRSSENGEDVPKQTPFVCQLCQKAYERADHLNRHLDSHRNERTFRCSECPRGFNRRDLLLRHQATHAKNSAAGRSGPDRTAERAFKACDACVLAKLKCDNERPCKRCQKRQTTCSTESLDRLNQTPPQFDTADTFPTPPSDGNLSIQGSLSSLPMVDPQLPSLGTDLGLVSWPEAGGGMDGFEFPAFYEHIMVPGHDFMSTEPIAQLPPDLSMVMPDKDWLGEMDVFGNDFTPTIDQALEAYAFPDMALNAMMQSETIVDQPAESNASKRHAIFQRSQWLWKPETNQNAFSEHKDLPLDESSIDMAASPHQPFLPSLTMQDTMSARSRDRLFQMVLRAAKSHVAIPSFPSAACLDTLLKVGIAKRIETDAWIHPYTFRSDAARPELLGALIAAGCVCFGISTVNKTGLVLFEIVRVALNRLLEDDNSVIRDLGYSQACMMWLDINAFCGFKRKMEIAESNLQPLVTASALRRAGKFDQVAYKDIAPSQSDQGIALETKWRAWVEQESYKRLVYHVYEHDIYSTVAKVRNPLLSYAEMSAPLPAPREVWLAPTAEAWKAAYLERLSSGIHAVSLRDLLADPELIRSLPDTVDERVAKTQHLYGVAAQTWEYYQQAILTASPKANHDPSVQLVLQSRHQRLYQVLQDTQPHMQGCLAVTRLLHEFSMMNLHVNADEVTRFAGKCGEIAANAAYQELQPWSQSKQSRIAVFHAGQAIFAARAVPPYQLRGPDASIIYHTIMVLWTYGMMQRDAARRTGNATPVGKSRAPELDLQGPRFSTEASQVVFIDDPASSQHKTFIANGRGRPCLHMQVAQNGDSSTANEESCDLRNPQSVMRVGVNVLQGNYPNTVPDQTRSNLPQLIKSLCDLMDELGSLK